MIRNSSGINLDNAIVILDEAHNIESACIDAGSFEFTESELMQHIEHMQERSPINV
jgi:Rad3-related DNA helicase